MGYAVPRKRRHDQRWSLGVRWTTYRLGLLVEDGLGLTTVTALLSLENQQLFFEKPKQFLFLSPSPCLILVQTFTSQCPKSPAQKPVPDSRSYRRFPWAAKESLPFLYWVTLWGVCFLHALPLQSRLSVVWSGV